MKTKHSKKIFRAFALSLFFIFALTVSNLQAQIWPPAGMQGAGTESSPWQIVTPVHLEALALYVNAGNGDETNGKYYKMMNNIDLSVYAQGEGWMPIGRRVSSTDFSKAFQGSFNALRLFVKSKLIKTNY